jgi:stage II sporulation protein D
LTKRLSSLPAGVALAALAACIAVPAVATATSVSFTFYGRGDGHGIGLSQYGAEGAARAGWSAPRILAWFYRSTTIGHVVPGAIRVELSAGGRQVAVGIRVGGVLVDGSGVRHRLAPGVRYLARIAGARVVLVTASGRQVGTAGAVLRVVPGPAGTVEAAGRVYRGRLDIGAAGGVRVVNVVPLEQYLRGVVTSEMPASWRPAALAAQAIAARSYAVHARTGHGAFDLYADTRSQAYGGVGAETPSGNRAVAATSGEVVTYHGSVVDAFFAASDGGYTESVQNVWGGVPTPYLVAVPDPFDAIAPKHLWSRPPRFSGAQLGRLLGTGGTVTSVAIVRRGVSPRVISARVTLSSGRRVLMGGDRIAAALGLPSTWFWIWQSNLARPHEPLVAAGSSVTPAPHVIAPTQPTPVGGLVPSGPTVATAGAPPAP